ncbi:MAG: DUF2950 family protein [Dinoroseobacter sp.]|nr:DUF2950 family protein [Dinoroseobacter sp.]
MARIKTIASVAFFLSTAALADPATYDSPQAALDAFIKSVENQDQSALLTVFGAGSADLLSSGDPAEDSSNREAVLALYREGYRFRPEESGLTLVLGKDSWPFPIPLTQTESGWQFDIEAGREEVENREIGRNELDVIDLLDAYVDLQAAFRLVDHDKDGVMEFARNIISEPGSRNGLFWPDSPSFVGETLARAELTGWSDGETDFELEPFFGYYYTILHGQGDNAPGGAFSYLAGDNLIGGHAMLAVPAEYGVTGVHSFLVSENGIVFEADLGESTLELTDSMTLYELGPDWEPVE